MARQEIDFKALRPYGDTTNDGAVQLSFTLPIEPGPRAQEAATQLVRKWGFGDAKVAHMSRVGEGYAFFVVFAHIETGIDYDQVKVPELHTERRSYKEIDQAIGKAFKRPLRVVGACTGFDAHTVGLDAILNMKGFDGDIGLERYKHFEVTNMGSQVPAKELVAMAIKKKADAILVSKIVTQKEIHVHDLKDILAQIKAQGKEDQFVLVAGGPRVTHKMALELGFDAGFGIGTMPSDVANFIYEQVKKKKK